MYTNNKQNLFQQLPSFFFSDRYDLKASIMKRLVEKEKSALNNGDTKRSDI